MTAASSDSITIQSENLFKDVLIVAPKVRIKSAFRGSVQILATDTVIIEEGCKLEYPSSVIMFPLDFMKLNDIVLLITRAEQ